MIAFTMKPVAVKIDSIIQKTAHLSVMGHRVRVFVLLGVGADTWSSASSLVDMNDLAPV